MHLEKLKRQNGASYYLVIGCGVDGASNLCHYGVTVGRNSLSVWNNFEGCLYSAFCSRLANPSAQLTIICEQYIEENYATVLCHHLINVFIGFLGNLSNLPFSLSNKIYKKIPQTVHKIILMISKQSNMENKTSQCLEMRRYVA